MLLKHLLYTLAFTIGISSAFAQKTYNVSLYSKMFWGQEHSRWMDFKDTPTDPGTYIIFQPKAIMSPVICGKFLIDDSGKLLNKTKYGCCFEDINFNDEDRWAHTKGCPDSDVYALNKIITYGYKKAELDTLLLVGYTKSNVSSHQVKTLKLHANNLQPYEYIFHEISLDYAALPCNLDYQIVLKNNDTFRINHITARLYIPRDSSLCCFCTMYGYDINGRQQNSNQFILIKPGLEEDYSKYLRNEE